MWDNLPSEIEFEFMKRLPVKSLMRFRSVAKSWKSLIDSSRFVSNYNLRQNQPHIFIVYQIPGYLGMRYVSVVDDDNFPKNMVDLSEILTDSAKQSSKLTLVGSSQGLLCLYSDSNAIIWNPCIRKSVTVPGDFTYSYHCKYVHVVGFGVCPKTSDPKLVQLTFPRKWLKNDTWKADVYSLSSGLWKSHSFSQISDMICGSFELSPRSECVDGFIYWCAFNEDNNNGNMYWVIISFNLTSEEFGVIYLPDILQRHLIMNLSKYRESLVLLPDDYENYHDYDVWMMEGGVRKSFKKLFTIKSINKSRQYPIAISYNGEAVLKITEYYGKRSEASIQTYEPSSNRFKWTTITGAYGNICMSSYMESMLLHDYCHTFN